ncbi:MAG TPA: DNA starvation/stationary phase protection protein [Rhizomicrobium sp.]|jgi:starvation-inducible DNA-binding protein
MAKKPASPKTSARIATHTDLSGNAVPEIAEALNGLVADSFSLYTKTKNFHWHVSGPHFRDYHLLMDDQATEIFATIDELAERVRKIGSKTIHSIGEIASLSTIKDNDKDYVSPEDMLIELMNDNQHIIKRMRVAHEIADRHEDVATASILENFIDQAEKRNWFLFEASRTGTQSGH